MEQVTLAVDTLMPTKVQASIESQLEDLGSCSIEVPYCGQAKSRICSHHPLPRPSTWP